MNEKTDWFKKTKIAIKQAFPDDKIIADNIDNIGEFILAKKIAWQADEKAKKLCIDFLEEADRDVKSCKVLYSKKIYSHSVYHFQQAVEKAMKAYCLGLGILKIEEVTGHDTPYVLLKGFEKTGLMVILKSSDIKTQSFLDKAWEPKSDLEKRLGIAKMPYEQIIHELDAIESDKRQIEQLIRSLLTGFLKVNKKTPPLEITTLAAMGSLYRLGVMSFPHEAFTRYPDNERMAPRDYTRELGIVKAIPKMTGFLVNAIRDLTQAFRAS